MTDPRDTKPAVPAPPPNLGIPEPRTNSCTEPCDDDDSVPHKPEPHPWEPEDRYGVWMVRDRNCFYCDKPIQRRGLLRRWRHVT